MNVPNPVSPHEDPALGCRTGAGPFQLRPLVKSYSDVAKNSTSSMAGRLLEASPSLSQYWTPSTSPQASLSNGSRGRPAIPFEPPPFAADHQPPSSRLLSTSRLSAASSTNAQTGHDSPFTAHPHSSPRRSTSVVPERASFLVEGIPTDFEFRADLVDDGIGGAISRSSSSLGLRAGPVSRSASFQSLGSTATPSTISRSSSRFTDLQYDTDSTAHPASSRELSYEAFEAGLLDQRGLSGSVSTGSEPFRRSSTHKPIVSLKGHAATLSGKDIDTKFPRGLSDSILISTFPLQNSDMSFEGDRNLSFEVEEPSFYASAESSFQADFSSREGLGGIELVGGTMGEMDVVDESEPSDGDSESEITEDEDKENRKPPRPRVILAPMHEAHVLTPVRYNAEADRSLRSLQYLHTVVDDRSHSPLEDITAHQLEERYFRFGSVTSDGSDNWRMDDEREVSRLLWDDPSPETVRYTSPLRRSSASPYDDLDIAPEQYIRDASEEILYQPPTQAPRTPSAQRTRLSGSHGSVSPGIIGEERKRSHEKSSGDSAGDLFSPSSSRVSHSASTPARRSFFVDDTGSPILSSPSAKGSCRLLGSSSDPIGLAYFDWPLPPIVPSILFIPAAEETVPDLKQDFPSNEARLSPARAHFSPPKSALHETDLVEDESITRGRRLPKPAPLGPFSAPSHSQRNIRRVSREPSPRLHVIEEVSSIFSAASDSRCRTPCSPPPGLEPRRQTLRQLPGQEYHQKNSIWTLSSEEGIAMSYTASDVYTLPSTLLQPRSHSDDENDLPSWWHGAQDESTGQLWDAIPNVSIKGGGSAAFAMDQMDRDFQAAEEGDELQAIFSFCVEHSRQEAFYEKESPGWVRSKVPFDLVSVFGRIPLQNLKCFTSPLPSTVHRAQAQLLDERVPISHAGWGTRTPHTGLRAPSYPSTTTPRRTSTPNPQQGRPVPAGPVSYILRPTRIPHPTAPNATQRPYSSVPRQLRSSWETSDLHLPPIQPMANPPSFQAGARHASWPLPPRPPVHPPTIDPNLRYAHTPYSRPHSQHQPHPPFSMPPRQSSAPHFMPPPHVQQPQRAPPLYSGPPPGVPYAESSFQASQLG